MVSKRKPTGKYDALEAAGSPKTVQSKTESSRPRTPTPRYSEATKSTPRSVTSKSARTGSIKKGKERYKEEVSPKSADVSGDDHNDSSSDYDDREEIYDKDHQSSRSEDTSQCSSVIKPKKPHGRDKLPSPSRKPRISRSTKTRKSRIISGERKSKYSDINGIMSTGASNITKRSTGDDEEHEKSLRTLHNKATKCLKVSATIIEEMWKNGFSSQ